MICQRECLKEEDVTKWWVKDVVWRGKIGSGWVRGGISKGYWKGGCRQVPRLPAKNWTHHNAQGLPPKIRLYVHVIAVNAHRGGVHSANWEPSAPPEPAQSNKHLPFYGKCHSISRSVILATQSCAWISKLFESKSCESKLCASKLYGEVVWREDDCG